MTNSVNDGDDCLPLSHSGRDPGVWLANPTLPPPVCETVRLLRETPSPLTGKDLVVRRFDFHD